MVNQYWLFNPINIGYFTQSISVISPSQCVLFNPILLPSPLIFTLTPHPHPLTLTLKDGDNTLPLIADSKAIDNYSRTKCHAERLITAANRYSVLTQPQVIRSQPPSVLRTHRTSVLRSHSSRKLCAVQASLLAQCGHVVFMVKANCAISRALSKYSVLIPVRTSTPCLSLSMYLLLI